MIVYQVLITQTIGGFATRDSVYCGADAKRAFEVGHKFNSESAYGPVRIIVWDDGVAIGQLDLWEYKLDFAKDFV